LKLLANPLFLRMVLVAMAGGFAFVLGVFIIRKMRRQITTEAVSSNEPASLESLPLHTYHAVIQQLKQQKHELQSSQQAERRRAKTSENISSAVLANLSSGVMFVGTNGLVRQANAAARQILGFAAPVGMALLDIFREAAPSGNAGITLAQAIQNHLQEKGASQRLEVAYMTPSGEARVLEVAVTSVQSAAGEPLGAACLIHDQTELARIRRIQTLQGEISAEMALQLRSSLSTISDCARRLAALDDPQAIQQLASDIASEAAHLNHTIGGFLTEPRTTGAAAGA
jgi:PAS domain S-box-containing protein